MRGKTKVSVSVQTSLLHEVQRVAGGASRSAIFGQALAHWLRERRQAGLERSIEDYYNTLSVAERTENDAWAESGDDTVRRVWSGPKR